MTNQFEIVGGIGLRVVVSGHEEKLTLPEESLKHYWDTG